MDFNQELSFLGLDSAPLGSVGTSNGQCLIDLDSTMSQKESKVDSKELMGPPLDSNSLLQSVRDDFKGQDFLEQSTFDLSLVSASDNFGADLFLEDLDDEASACKRQMNESIMSIDDPMIVDSKKLKSYLDCSSDSLGPSLFDATESDSSHVKHGDTLQDVTSSFVYQRTDLSDVIEEEEENDKENVKPNRSSHSAKNLSALFSKEDPAHSPKSVLSEIKILADPETLNDTVSDYKLEKSNEKSADERDDQKDKSTKNESLNQSANCTANHSPIVSRNSLNASTISTRLLFDSFSNQKTEAEYLNTTKHEESIMNESASNGDLNCSKQLVIRQIIDEVLDHSLIKNQSMSHRLNESDLENDSNCSKHLVARHVVNELLESSLIKNQSMSSRLNESNVSVQSFENVSSNQVAEQQTSDSENQSKEFDHTFDDTENELPKTSKDESTNRSFLKTEVSFVESFCVRQSITSNTSMIRNVVDSLVNGVECEKPVDDDSILENQSDSTLNNSNVEATGFPDTEDVHDGCVASKGEMTFTAEDRLDLLETKLEYETKIVGLQEMVDDLNDKLNEADDTFQRENVSELLQTKLDYENRIVTLEEKIEKLEEDFANHHNDEEIHLLKEKFEQNELQLKESLEKSARHQSELSEKDCKIYDLSAEIEELKNKIKAQESTNQEMKDEFKRQLQFHETELWNFREKEAELLDEITVAQALAEKYSDENWTLKKNLETAQSELENLREQPVEKSEDTEEVKKLQDKLVEAEEKFQIELAVSDEKLKTETDRLMSEIVEWKSKFDKSDSELSQSKTSHFQLQAEYSSLKRQYEDDKFVFEEKLIESEVVCTELQNEMANLRVSKESVKSELETAKREAAEKMFELERQVTLYESRKCELQAALENATEANQLLETQMIDLRGEFAKTKEAMQTQLEDEQVKIRQLQDQLSSQVERESQLLEKISDLEAKLESESERAGETEGLKQQLEKSQSSLVEKQSLIDGLRRDLDLQMMELESTVQQVEQRQAQIDMLQEKQKTLEFELDRNGNLNCELKNQIETYENESTAVRNQLSEAHMQITLLSEAVQAKAQQIEQLNRQVTELSELVEQEKHSKEQLQEKLETVTKQNESLIVRLDFANQSLDSAGQLNSSLQLQLDESRNKLTNALEENLKQVHQITQTERAWNDARGKLELNLQKQNQMLVKFKSDNLHLREIHKSSKAELSTLQNTVKSNASLAKKITEELNRLSNKLDASNKDSIKAEVIKKLFLTINKRLTTVAAEGLDQGVFNQNE